MFAKEDKGALDVSAKFDVDEDIFFTGEIIRSRRGRVSFCMFMKFNLFRSKRVG